jgi:hypothetical protein
MSSMNQRPRPRRKALLIGINYNNDPSAMLNGCYNDVVNVAQYLRSVLGYAAADITVLTDGNRGSTGVGTASSVAPTRQNILAALSELVQDTGHWCVIPTAMKQPVSTHVFAP